MHLIAQFATACTSREYFCAPGPSLKKFLQYMEIWKKVNTLKNFLQYKEIWYYLDSIMIELK